jgi:hypothetical protein
MILVYFSPCGFASMTFRSKKPNCSSLLFIGMVVPLLDGALALWRSKKGATAGHLLIETGASHVCPSLH